MPTANAIRPMTRAEGRDLILNAIIDAPPEKVFRAWTEPSLITQLAALVAQL